MYYAAIKRHDVANGPGVRVSLFVSGCEHACPGCFNAEAWNFSYGEKYTQQTEEAILQALTPVYIRGLSLLGGEPLHPRNSAAIAALAARVRKAYPAKDIWCYTGYDFERELLPSCATSSALRALLGNTDILVDGRYIAAQKNLNLRFRGSANQRILLARESLAAGQAILAQRI
ncbi:MAG: anaerobic ribonucleoside-triphosphate reductase activating protein [Oscillospiraceae bacterium]|jgi:anaerobic ribonucleoside-triphosphate reductase activating protein|nr:anaerobic ribonucleoside-triphosphate reductase activating protein [Oscillospiraceae bacterium]